MADKSKVNIQKTPPPMDRIMKDVPPPIATPLDSNVLFNRKSPNDPLVTVNTAALQSHLLQEGKLHKEDVLIIVERCTELYAQEPNVLSVAAPLTVCGDVHGQYYDLVKLLEVGGKPEDTTYLFLGDYVDRGSFSLEVVLLLFAYKINFPKTFLMIRGNHECRHLTQYFTFRTECIRKYGLDVYDAIMDAFDALPLAALMNNQFLCVHGGISPQIHSIDDIAAIDRFCEPPQSGPMCDLLWADPMEDFNPDSPELFAPNDVRGCSFLFSYRAVCQFLDRNGLLSIIRAHEAQDQGYRMHLTNEATGFPSVITLFSAPNYLDAYNNKGAVLRYENNVMNIRQFNHSPHPYWLPNFMNVITWSLPFVAEKVSEMLLTVLNLIDTEVDVAAEEGDEQARLRAEEASREKVKRERLDRLKNKVKGVSKMLKMYSLLTSERETILQLKAFTPENKIPAGLLTSGVDAIRDALGNFEKSKVVDRVNEMRPASPVGSTPVGPNKRLHALRSSSSDRLIAPK